MSLSISIVGCGWLGLSLAESLLAKGYQVLGSTTSAEKTSLLQKKGIDTALFKLNPMPEGHDFNKLFQADVMVVNIPPKAKSHTALFYREQIKYLKYQLQSSAVKKVIFISSTSYYPNTNTVVNENTPYDINNGSKQAVVWAEQEIAQIDQELSILRCGGLMGNGRIPGKWFSGKPTTGAQTPVNYVHLNDIIEVIKQMVVESSWPAIRNLVNQDHLTRKEVAQAMSKKYGFEAPQWINPETIPFKKVETLYANNFKDPLTY